MISSILLLLSGAALSIVAIYYSVTGLGAIFAGAAIPIYIMGTTLEISKIVAASWLKQNWHRASLMIKYYMSIAVLILMLITSMGIFGFLSKAHLDQAAPVGGVIEKIELIDEKINLEKSNIERLKSAMLQLDSQVNEMLSRTTDARGTSRAVQLRRQQATERADIKSAMDESQRIIAALQEQKLPLSASLRAIESEVGPIKYIAAFIYGETPDENILEKAVTWMIILIIIVFDPLAIAMLLAAQMSFNWYRQDQLKSKVINVVQPSDISTDKATSITDVDNMAADNQNTLSDNKDENAYLRKPFDHFKNLKPMVYKPEEESLTPESNEELPIVDDSTSDPSIPVNEDTDTVTVQEELIDDTSKKKSYMIKQNGQQILKNL